MTQETKPPQEYVFVAFASEDALLAETVVEAAKVADGALKYLAWTEADGSGSPVKRSVESWIGHSTGVVADISIVNDNVTYEIGFAIGAGKDVRLIRHAGKDIREVKEIGLLDGVIYDNYQTRADLVTKLTKASARKSNWHPPVRNKEQPIYVVAPSKQTATVGWVFNAVKKSARLKFRSFKPWEIGRISAQEMFDHVASSFGVVLMWEIGSHPEARKTNQRTAFAYGLARGLEIPVVLFAPERSELPADMADGATYFAAQAPIDAALRKLKDEALDAMNEHVEEAQLPFGLLDALSCGDAAAENEQEQLRRYFLETDDFKSTLDGAANVIVGRKGSGKTAVFLQVRDRTRSNKRNVVVDLNPEGFQLLKLKEMMVSLSGLGARKEFTAAFWEYVVWLEIAYKLLEKDKDRAARDWELAQRYDALGQLFSDRVDTGIGDFSERLKLLIEIIASRFSAAEQSGSVSTISSKILEMVYGNDIAQVRDAVISYLKLKGVVFFLFDNIDRMRAPGGFDDDDAIIITGLVEAMQELARKFRKAQLEFAWAVFLRSDVYEFLLKSMADYGKLKERRIEWTDREMLKRVLKRRVLSTLKVPESDWNQTWQKLSAPMIDGKPTLDVLVDASLMRPRYLIRALETAKRRALNMGHQRIEEADYKSGLEELGWTVVEDLNRELADIVPRAEYLLFDIGELEGACGLPELRDAISKRTGTPELTERVIDVLLWSGCIGIDPGTGGGIKFIFDCGYQRAFLRTLMERNPDSEIRLHPTLSALLATRRQAAA